jgi:hypothetical protein
MVSGKTRASGFRHFMLVSVLTLFFVATLSACGGDSDGDNGNASGGSGNPAPASGDSAASAPDSAATAPADTAASSPSDGDIEPDVCAFLKDVFHGSGGGPSDLPPDQLMKIFDALPDRSPAEIRDDVRLLVDAFQPVLQLAQALGVEHADDVDSLSADDQQRFREAVTAMSEGEVGEASGRIDVYLVGKC